MSDIYTQVSIGNIFLYKYNNEDRINIRGYAQFYKHAYDWQESQVIDVGDYIIGSWYNSTYISSSDSREYVVGYHIIRKSDMYVRPSAILSYDNCLCFIAKGTKNTVYYAVGSNLYHATVSANGLQAIKLITIIPDGCVSMANDEYLVFYSASTIRTIRISNDAVYTSVFPTGTSIKYCQSALLENYLILYSLLEDGNISYTRIDVTSGASIISTISVFTPPAGATITTNDGGLYVFSNPVKNVALLSYKVYCVQKPDGEYKYYIVLADKNGLISKKEAPRDFYPLQCSHNEEEGLLTYKNIICKYTSTNIAISELSFTAAYTGTGIGGIKCILPWGNFLYSFGDAVEIEKAVLNSTLSKLTSIHLPNFIWDPGGNRASIYTNIEVLATFKESNSSGLIFSCTMRYSGSGLPVYYRNVYIKVPIETHPLVSIK